MREILFRGRRVDTCEWVEGGYYKEPYTDNVHIVRWCSFGLGFAEYIKVFTATVGQYTGLKDKHGKMIFEGDIIALDLSFRMPDNIFYIRYEGGEYVVRSKKHKLFRTALVNLRANSIEVIGNIHDNRELFDNSEQLEV